MSNIRDRDALARSLRDWSFLGGCFGSSAIKPSDIDGIVEVRGRFLVLESKMPGTPAKRGQARLLVALAKLPNFTVVTIIGKPIIAMQKPGDRNSTAASDRDVCAFVSAWYAKAIVAQP